MFWGVIPIRWKHTFRTCTIQICHQESEKEISQAVFERHRFTRKFNFIATDLCHSSLDIETSVKIFFIWIDPSSYTPFLSNEKTWHTFWNINRVLWTKNDNWCSICCCFVVPIGTRKMEFFYVVNKSASGFCLRTCVDLFANTTYYLMLFSFSLWTKKWAHTNTPFLISINYSPCFLFLDSATNILDSRWYKFE